MSLYGNQIQIGGVTCGMVTRGSSNGRYLAVFEREFASLEGIEAIAWDKPEIQGECILPQGYGFTVIGISYSSATRSYTVELQVAQQYLGDVAGYQTQVSELEARWPSSRRTSRPKLRSWRARRPPFSLRCRRWRSRRRLLPSRPRNWRTSRPPFRSRRAPSGPGSRAGGEGCYHPESAGDH